MLPPVYRTLHDDAAVKAIVGTRIYAHGDAPPDTERPYITWQVIVGTPENSLADAPDIDRWVLQINCWHPQEADVETLAKAVRDVVQQHGYVTDMPGNRRDTETKLYWIAIRMDWLLHR